MAVATRPRFWIAAPSRRMLSAKHAGDTFTLLVGLTTPFAFHLVGDLPIGEALLIGALPVLVILGGRRALKSQLRPVYALMALWLLGLIIADVYNHTNMTDRMRGMAGIVFFGLDLFAFSILLGGNNRRKLWFFIGLSIGALASVKLQPSEAAADYPWKFGYAWGTMQATLLICSYFYSRRWYVPAATCILVLIVVNLLLNFRSPVLYLLITLVLIIPIIPQRIGGLQILPSGRVARVVVLMILALGAGQAANSLIGFVTQAGYISEAAQEKNASQAKGGNLLVGGRPEFVVGLRAALDSPLIGHGSWAKDLKYFEMLNDAMIEAGVQTERGDPDQDADGLIPGHSHIITAWVWAGIAGPIFWLYILWIIFQGIVRVSILRPALAPLFMWMMLGALWDIFFSPFAFTRRLGESILIVIVTDLLEKRVVRLSPDWRRMGSINPSGFFGKSIASTGAVKPRNDASA